MFDAMFIRNVKLSAKLERIPLDIAIERLSSKKVSYKTFGNFITFRKKYSYVLFKPSKNNLTHINITKVPKLKKSVLDSVRLVEKLLDSKIVRFSVDNIIATTDLNKKINLAEITTKPGISILYNSERFPGLFIKFCIGTSIVYHSGKIVIVGCKTIEGLNKIKKWLCANI